jgi:CubicO group peptidase (beta-lactamase class C family)
MKHYRLPWASSALGAVFAAMLLLGCRSTPKVASPVVIGKGDEEAVRQRLTGIIEEEMRANGIVGLSIALVDDQQTVWSRGFGYADREAGIAATADTAYRIGSVSKLFVATSVMQLAEQGMVDIDRPYGEKVAGFRIRSRFPDSAPVTVRNLLTHHAGLPDIVPEASRDPDTGMLLLPDLSEEYLALPPNLMFSYSNVGYRLLGCLVESATGRTFADYIDAHVLKPVGMKNSSFGGPASKLISKGYADGKALQPPPMYDPAGSLWSTVEDLGRFMKMVFAGGAIDGNRVIGAGTLQEMLSVQNGGVPLDLDTRIGLGWHLFDLTGLLPGGTRAAGHTGYDTIFTSFLLVLPDLKLGVAVLCNSDEGGSAPMNIGYRAIELMHEASTGIHLDPQPIPEEDVAAEIRLTPAELERYTGFYETNGDDAFIEILLKAGRLVSTVEGKKVQIVPLAGGRFTVRLLLFGFLPVRVKELERSTFSFEVFCGRTVLVEHRGPYRRLAGTRLESPCLPAGWRNRLGTWECVDAGAGMVYERTLTLREQSGFLVLGAETWGTVRQSSLPWGAVLQPISDAEAIIPGIQHSRSAGATLRAIAAEGGELLRFEGYLFRRASP